MILDGPAPTFMERQVQDTARILAPYIRGMLHTETITHVLVSGREATFVDLDPADPCGYGRLLDRWWNRGTALVVIEQDMVPMYGFMGEFEGCPQPFCSYRYDCNGPTKAYGLGLCRFSAQLQAAHPTLAAQAAGMTAGRTPSTHWRALNERVLSLTEHVGARVHLHKPDAGHLHDYTREVAHAGHGGG